MEHTIRHRDGKTVKVSNYTRNRAIKCMCTECLGWGEDQPSACTAPLCPLYPYRGKLLVAISRQAEGRISHGSVEVA
jgi:hypothetical protein